MNKEVYSIKCIYSTEAFQNLETDWKNLEKTSNNQYHTTSFDWQYNWWSAFKDRYDKKFGHKKDLRILLLYKKDLLIGIAPFVKITRRTRCLLNKTSIELLGQQWAGCCLDFIGDLSAAEVALFFEWLYKNEKFDLISLSYLPENTNNFSCQTLHPFSECPIVKTNNYDSYKEYEQIKYDKNFRKNILKRTRRIERECGAICLKAIEGFKDAQTTKEALEVLALLSAKKKVDNKHTIYDDLDKKLFLSNMLQLKNIYVYILHVNDKPVAYQLCFKQKNTTVFLDTSYDRSFRSYGVGIILESLVIKYIFEQNNLINLGTGASYYKSKFADNSIVIHKHFKKGNTPLGLLWLFFEQRKQKKNTALFFKKRSDKKALTIK